MRIGYLMQAGAPDLCTLPRSGPATHVWHTCHELQNLGHELRLLTVAENQVWRSDDLRTFAPVTVNMDRGARFLAERGVRRMQSALHLPYLHFFDSMRFAAACRQELRDCDVLYERMGWMGCGGAIAARDSGQPLILEVNGDHLSEYEMLGVAPRGVQRAASLRFMRWATQQAAWVVATGDGWRRQFLERWRFDPRRATVVENGSEVVTLLRRNDIANFGSSRQPGQPVKLVFVGAFEPWQGIDVLLEALVVVVGQQPAIHLDLIGDGSGRREIERLISEYKLEPYVTLHGFLPIEQAASILGRSEIGLSPYCGRAEYSGLKLLDYKSAGLAIIASGEGSEPYVLRHGQTGWMVPPCDMERLAAAILALSGDASLRRRIGQAARIEAEAQHSWRHTAEQLVEIFERVVHPK